MTKGIILIFLAAYVLCNFMQLSKALKLLRLSLHFSCRQPLSGQPPLVSQYVIEDA